MIHVVCATRNNDTLLFFIPITSPSHLTFVLSIPTAIPIHIQHPHHILFALCHSQNHYRSRILLCTCVFIITPQQSKPQPPKQCAQIPVAFIFRALKDLSKLGTQLGALQRFPLPDSFKNAPLEQQKTMIVSVLQRWNKTVCFPPTLQHKCRNHPVYVQLVRTTLHPPLTPHSLSPHTPSHFLPLAPSARSCIFYYFSWFILLFIHLLQNKKTHAPAPTP